MGIALLNSVFAHFDLYYWYLVDVVSNDNKTITYCFQDPSKIVSMTNLFPNIRIALARASHTLPGQDDNLKLTGETTILLKVVVQWRPIYRIINLLKLAR